MVLLYPRRFKPFGEGRAGGGKRVTPRSFPKKILRKCKILHIFPGTFRSQGHYPRPLSRRIPAEAFPRSPLRNTPLDPIHTVPSSPRGREAPSSPGGFCNRSLSLRPTPFTSARSLAANQPSEPSPHRRSS